MLSPTLSLSFLLNLQADWQAEMQVYDMEAERNRKKQGNGATADATPAG